MVEPVPVGAKALEAAARALSESSRAFSAANLFHEARRRAGLASRPGRGELEAFVRGPLAARLRRGPILGLLPRRRHRLGSGRLPSEWAAYFPAAILMVDRSELVDLIVASGVVVQGRIAVVSLQGEPANVVRWLAEGFRAGHRAPVGFLHDASTVVYPFAFEPLRTLVAAELRVPISYRDLGLHPRGLPLRALPFLSKAAFGERRFFELEEAPPSALVAHAARSLLELVPPDPMLLPLKGGAGGSSGGGGRRMGERRAG